MEDISSKTNKAFKWSTATEVLAKFITPAINMVLARILSPEEFGILATVTMIISFAEVFVESGMQKFLIQHDFGSEESERRHMSTALWANLAFSFSIWLLLVVFRSPIATLAGDPGHGLVIAISGIAVPMYGVIGIQNSRLKKNMNFKALFFVRIFSSLVPLVITLPLALLGLKHWALIIGYLMGIAVQFLLLIFFSDFKPMLHFKFTELRSMLSYGVWTTLDGMVIWLTSWIDALLIATYMNEYQLGLYKNSNSLMVSLFSVVNASVFPVLFSALSKLKDDDDGFKRMLLNAQGVLSAMLMPIGVGLWFYRDFVTRVALGDQWGEAADVLGIIGIMTALRIIFVSTYSDAYRAKGHFRYPLVLQLCDLAVLIPACMISVRYGFLPLVYTRAILKLDLFIPSAILLYKVVKISPWQTFKTLLPSVSATFTMIGAILILQRVGSAFWWNAVSIAICIVVYFSVLFIFKKERERFLYPTVKKLKRIIGKK